MISKIKKFLCVALYCILAYFLVMLLITITSSTISCVRKKTFKIDLPKLPSSYTSYDVLGDFSAEYELTDITYEIDGEDLVFTFKGKKIYDIDGNDEPGKVEIIWQLIDGDGNVVASDEADSPQLTVGEKFSLDSKDYKFNIDLSEDYELVIRNATNNAPELPEKYEELFLGKWTHDGYLLSFQYKDGIYCGGALNSDGNTVLFKSYKASDSLLTLHLEDGSYHSFRYIFEEGYLYLDDNKFSPFE